MPDPTAVSEALRLAAKVRERTFRSPEIQNRVHEIVFALDKAGLWLPFEGWAKALLAEFPQAPFNEKSIRVYLDGPHPPDDVKIAWRRIRERHGRLKVT